MVENIQQTGQVSDLMFQALSAAGWKVSSHSRLGTVKVLPFDAAPTAVHYGVSKLAPSILRVFRRSVDGLAR
jgi:hypothetical protein